MHYSNCLWVVQFRPSNIFMQQLMHSVSRNCASFHQHASGRFGESIGTYLQVNALLLLTATTCATIIEVLFESLCTHAMPPTKRKKVTNKYGRPKLPLSHWRLGYLRRGKSSEGLREMVVWCSTRRARKALRLINAKHPRVDTLPPVSKKED